jgi:hypothetical protein
MNQIPTLLRSYYPPVIIEMILERISKGEPLGSVCSDPGMPARQTWQTWCAQDSLLTDRYVAAQARGLLARRSLTI